MPRPYERKVGSYEQLAKRQVAAATQGMRDPDEIRMVLRAIHANVEGIAKASGVEAEVPSMDALMDQVGKPFVLDQSQP